MVAWILYMFVYFRRQVTALKAPAAKPASAAGRPDARDVAIADDTMPVDPPDPLSGKERGIAIFAAAVSAIFFVTFTAFPVSVGRALGPIPVLCISAANAVFVGSLLAWLGRKYRVPFVAILLALAAVFSL